MDTYNIYVINGKVTVLVQITSKNFESKIFEFFESNSFFQKILPEMILTCTFENGGEMNHRNAP